jgi:isochorismate synthase
VKPTSRSVDPAGLDLLAVAGEDGFLYEMGGVGLAGRGELSRCETPFSGIRDLKRALEVVSGDVTRFGPEAVAFVAIPFRETRPIVSVVPEVVARRASADASVLTLGTELAPDVFTYDHEMCPPTSFTATAQRSHKEYLDAVAEVIRRIRTGELSKAAFAREILVEADEPFSQVAALTSLRRSYPSSYLYAIDGLVGASPELLVERRGTSVHALPLAGTLPRSTDIDTDLALKARLLDATEQYGSEHRFLADMVRETLAPYCRVLDVPATPEILSLANVHHLSTRVQGTLESTSTSVLELVSVLHPTPAIGGTPTDAALRVIEELEELDRGYYAGAVGWVDGEGNGSFAIAIRCAQISGHRARVIAGGGIVANSDPERELEETRWKLQVMLSALVRP